MSEDITVTYTVQKVDTGSSEPSATVLFTNPFKTGPDDMDNPDVTKSVRIPFTAAGEIDTEEWSRRLEQQASGMLARFVARRVNTDTPENAAALSALVGHTGSLSQSAGTIETPPAPPPPAPPPPPPPPPAPEE